MYYGDWRMRRLHLKIITWTLVSFPADILKGILGFRMACFIAQKWHSTACCHSFGSLWRSWGLILRPGPRISACPECRAEHRIDVVFYRVLSFETSCKTFNGLKSLALIKYHLTQINRTDEWSQSSSLFTWILIDSEVEKHEQGTARGRGQLR